jgi:hypothetical protein
MYIYITIKTNNDMKNYNVKYTAWREEVLNKLNISFSTSNGKIYFKTNLQQPPVNFLIDKAIELDIRTY